MRRAAMPSVPTSWPQIRAVPEVGGMKPASMRMVVDLPAPFGPRNPSTSPRATLNDTSSTAMRWPKRLVRCSISISAALFGPSVTLCLPRRDSLDHAAGICRLAGIAEPAGIASS